MPTVEDALGAKTAFGSAAADGVNVLSLNQEVTFRLYHKLVLPYDGSVYWVRADLLSQKAVYNVMRFNAAAYNESIDEDAPQTTLQAQGSLHYSTVNEQNEDATTSVNRVIFTALHPVTDLNKVGPNSLYIGEFEGGLAPGGKIRFAFSSRGSFYQQAELWHYVGHAIYNMMATQIVDDPQHFNARQLVVSNSLPGWLAINHYAPPYPVPVPFPAIPLYPAWLTPLNIDPPYGTVHIEPDGTEGVAASPFLDYRLNQYQFATDRVAVTLFGANNDAALAFLAAMVQYSLDANVFGLTSIPAIRDDHRTQAEFQTLAMKKRIVCTVSYYQSTMRDVARQLLEGCFIDYSPQLPSPPHIGA